jgi:hypothetical protein
LESKPIYTKIVIGSVLLVAYMSMRAMGLTFGDLWEMARDQLDHTRAETRAYRGSDFSEQVSREMREQAAGKPGARPGAEGDINNEMATERKRMMDQSASTSAQNRDRMLKGDTETLTKRDRKDIRDAGGK